MRIDARTEAANMAGTERGAFNLTHSAVPESMCSRSSLIVRNAIAELVDVRKILLLVSFVRTGAMKLLNFLWACCNQKARATASGGL